MEIQNASTAPSKSNELRNVNTVRRESGNVITQPWGINNRKSEVIAFVVNAGINVTANNFYILVLEINENATLVFSISFQHGLFHQNFVFIRQLYFTYSIKRSFFVLIDC